MARFSKDIELKYGIKTYEETKKTYEWIEKSAKKWGREEANISINFLFDLGDIRCVATSIQEFIEITYGAQGYKLSSFFGSIDNVDKHISINFIFGKLSVSADSRVDLEDFLNALDKTSVEEQENAQITYIENQVNVEHQNNGTIVQGDNNTVVSKSSNVNLNTEKKESKFKKWVIAVSQNIVSNWIWYLLTAGVAALITYFSTKG